MLLPAAIGLALACQHSSPGDSATDAESPSTGETTAIARTAEPTGTTDSEESLRTCGAAGEQLLSYQFDAEPDCNVTLGGLHLSDLSFTDLTSISRLRAVHERLSFFRNESLTSMHGLEGLKSVGGLLIHHHPVLVDLGALARLTEIPGELYLASNDALAGLQGLENVQSVGSLTITSNAQLSSLAGLAGLKSVAGDVTIRDNPKLPQKEAEAFVAGLAVGGEVEVAGNGK